ncbi:hypothetical protein ACFY0G_23835 [Streptomyces sp. NPDC001552]|uniref:hypothetical protein n=1 Tax=Streptomyces sp. NPDC001552 TaxID=3364587 RepID=UPI0036A93BCA
MATKSLAHGMGTFFKDCEQPQTRWSKCPHEYTIRYRSAAGQQTEEAGFSTQEKAIDRLATVYQEKKAAPRNQSKAERIQKYGATQSASTPRNAMLVEQTPQHVKVHGRSCEDDRPLRRIERLELGGALSQDARASRLA